MPAGEGVAKPGWDGVVECRVGNRFVPAGRSVWEMSTDQKSAHGKACEDYDKRRQNTSESERAELSYVDGDQRKYPVLITEDAQLWGWLVNS